MHLCAWLELRSSRRAALSASWRTLGGLPTRRADARRPLGGGGAWNLWNNAWGTNYVMWWPFDNTPTAGDALFRFKLALG